MVFRLSRKSTARFLVGRQMETRGLFMVRTSACSWLSDHGNDSVCVLTADRIMGDAAAH